MPPRPPVTLQLVQTAPDEDLDLQLQVLGQTHPPGQLVELQRPIVIRTLPLLLRLEVLPRVLQEDLHHLPLTLRRGQPLHLPAVDRIGLLELLAPAQALRLQEERLVPPGAIGVGPAMLVEHLHGLLVAFLQKERPPQQVEPLVLLFGRKAPLEYAHRLGIEPVGQGILGPDQGRRPRSRRRRRQ